uniref:Putative secreted protein n=1 Tax=Nyssomyia neivai TaxID=330878 RepID=A0A1L8DNG5_9DIPT
MVMRMMTIIMAMTMTRASHKKMNKTQPTMTMIMMKMMEMTIISHKKKLPQRTQERMLMMGMMRRTPKAMTKASHKKMNKMQPAMTTTTMIMQTTIMIKMMMKMTTVSHKNK